MIFRIRLLPIPPFFLIGLSVFVTMAIYAQTENKQISDSLINKSSKELGESIKKSSPEEAKVYEIALSNLKNQDSAKTNEYYYIALSFYNTGKYERSAYYFDHAAKAAKKANYDQFLSVIYLKLGNSYLKDWKNQKALDSYYSALKIAQKNGNVKHEIVANSGITMIRRRMKQLDKALEVCKHSLKLTENSSFKNGKNHVNLITIISEIYLDQKKYDSVLYYADIGMRLTDPIAYHIGAIDLNTKKGAVFYYRNNIPKAFEYLHLAENIMLTHNIKDKKSIMNLQYFLARCYYKQGAYKKAITSLDSLLGLLEEKDSRNNRVLQAYRLLADCNDAIGNERESKYWLNKHTVLQAKFQDEKDKTVNKIYNKDTRELGETIKKLESKQQKEVKYSIIVVLALLISLFMIGGLFYKKQKINKTTFDNLMMKISNLESERKTETIESKGGTKEVVIDNEKINNVLKRLNRLEKQGYFLKSECSLSTMAKKVKTNTTYLSKIIKTHKEKSFNDYINDLRIEYALKKLKNDKKFRSFSIKSIALEIGYKSDNSFTKHFKSKTGLNPSYYIKEIEKLG
ncbi:helix-turn-helix domain-containing protein [Aquimarina sediminis]|uniref:helix-turn-helix domain-containing protein n=1 Tax=Aquimarina sediminis TaxID=2070536 RepID=UPI000CA04C6D|nr:helix-turn-helix domain-containing protein [Aquimarina sediminis]